MRCSHCPLLLSPVCFNNVYLIMCIIQISLPMLPRTWCGISLPLPHLISGNFSLPVLWPGDLCLYSQVDWKNSLYSDIFNLVTRMSDHIWIIYVSWDPPSLHSRCLLFLATKQSIFYSQLQKMLSFLLCFNIFLDHMEIC